MRTSPSVLNRGLAFPLLAAIAFLPAFPAGLKAEQPTVTVLVGTTVTNSIPSNGNANNKVVLQIAGLTAGETVQVNRYLDPTGAGTLDTTQPLVQSFFVTDGKSTSFSGVVDPRIPGDTDTVSGQITTKFSISSQAYVGQAAGSYVFDIVSPTGKFTAGTVTASLTITQPAFTQSISGVVTNGGSPVAGAGLFLFDLQGHGSGFISSVFSDATGHYSFQAAPGSYAIFSAARGLLGPAPFSLPALVSGVNLTGENIALTPATRTITSVVESTDGVTLIPGVQFYVMSKSAGLVSFGFSDLNGHVVLPVTAASDWNFSVDENSLDSIGFLPWQNSSGNIDTNAGNLVIPAAGFGDFVPATALIFGTLVDNTGSPIIGIDVNDGDSTNTFYDDFITNSNGAFFLLAAAGNWQVQADNNGLAALGLIAPNSVNLTIAAGTATSVTLTASQPSSFFTGTVKENGIPLAGVIVDANPQNGGNNIRATTGSDGSFNLGVSAGTWNLYLDSQSATQSSLVGPQLTETVGNNQTISGINYPVLPATGTLSGTAKDASGNPLSSNDNVFATATISNQFYSIYVNLDNSGNYSIPLINGIWTIGVSGQNGSIAGFLPTTVTISGANQTLNLTPLTPSATFSGTVTNNGVAMSGVLIDAQQQSNNNNNNSLEFQATTDAGGNFSLGVTSGSWNIFLDNSNNLVVPQLSESISTGQTIGRLTYPVLAASATVSGTVKDASGNPLPSSDNVSASGTVNGLQYNAFALLDNTGAYSLGLPDGVWNLGVYGPNGQVSNILPTNVTVTGSQNQTVNLAPFVPTSTFSGTVTKGGSPLAGVLVDASPQGGGQNIQATTDTSGNFSLGVFAGSWNIQVDGSSVLQDNLVTPAGLIETIASNQTLSGLNLPTLAATLTVSGTVKDGNGNLLSSAFNVNATATLNNIFYNVDLGVQSNGTYSLPLVNGTWTFNVFGPGGSLANFQPPTVTITGSQTLNLAPPQPTATFSGTVKNNGVPVAGITVFASLQNGGGNNSNSTTFQATTDSGGNFNLGVLSGSWNIYLDNPTVAQLNLVASSLNNESIANGQTLSGLALQVLTATGTISGTVSDYSGVPVVNSFVNLNATATVNGVGFISDVSTGNGSTFSLPVINGTWSVTANGAGLVFNSQTVTVSGSAVTNFGASVINSQPQNQTVTAEQNTTFFIGDNTPGIPTLQWQISTDGGNTFSNLSDNFTYTGSLTNELTVSNATTALNGALFRCAVSFTFNGTPLTQNSSAATLTVNKAPANVFLGGLNQAFTGGQCFVTATTSAGNLTVNITYNGSTTAPSVAGSYSVIATISDANFIGSTTGTLNILPDFAFYLSQFFNTAQLANPAITGPAANPAGDSMPNLMKYALGLNPTQVNAAAGAPVVGVSGGGNLTLTYISPPGITDVNYIVEVSSDLVTWNSGPAFTAVVSTTNLDAQHVQTIVRDLTPIVGNARRFIRLRVSQPLPP